MSGEPALIGVIHSRLPALLGGAILMITTLNHAETGSLSSPTSQGKGNSEEGRQIYNGKGFCYQCHGYDGYTDRLPQMSPGMRDMVGKMNPKPADFRNPATLKSKDDQDRFETIKNGHRGTSMFPHQYLRDAEINDILAYLSILRSEGKSSLRGSGKIRE
jgi:mono/diheme cytochrome c family protein